MTACTDLFESFIRMDRILADAGVPPTSDWWLREHLRFYSHPTALQHVARVGRGGDKSGQALKAGLCETVFGKFNVPVGQRHFYVYVSERLDEARKTLRTAEHYLDILGIGYRTVGDTIELAAMPRGIKVLPCTTGAVRGYRCIGYVADEVASWSVDGADPAPELAASLDAMTITHPTARSRFYSSPLSVLDHHYKLVEQGNDEHQVVSIAASWVANPGGITEEVARTKAKGNERIFRREYCAEPMAALSAVFDPALIDAATAALPEGELAAPILVLDPSSMRGDAFTSGIAQWFIPQPPERWMMAEDPKTGAAYVPLDDRGNRIPNPEASRPTSPLLVVHDVEAIDSAMSMAQAWAQHIAPKAKRYGCRRVVSDQMLSYASESEAPKYGLQFTEVTWTGATKPVAIERVHALFRDHAVRIPKDADLVKELYAFSARVTPAGTIQYGARRSGHDDRVAILLTAALADIEGLLSLSPIRRSTATTCEGSGW